MKNGVISVIVPIYGVDKYLEECIESIISQTYTKLEVILVDDGSPDRCGEICDRYAEMDNRITVIHQKNGGAAAARNAGLRIATGEFVAFVDGDDYLEPDAYEYLAAALVEHEADIAFGKFRNIYVNGVEIPNGVDETQVYSAAEYLVKFTEDWTCAITPNKLFRNYVLSNVFYEEGHLIDDEFFTYRAVMNAGRIVGIPGFVFNYRQRASSVMKNRSTIQRKCEDILAYLEKRYHDVTERFPALTLLYESRYLEYLLWLATSDMAIETTIKAIKRRLLAFLRGGKVRFWKKGQRKYALRMFVILAIPSKMWKYRKDGDGNSEYQLFE